MMILVGNTSRTGADIGVSGFGRSKEEAFAQAALALTGVITEPESVSADESVQIECPAPDDELLLVEWLNAVIYEMATRKMLFSRLRLVIEGGKLSASAWGEPVDVERHQPAVEVNGVTCTALSVSAITRDHGSRNAWLMCEVSRHEAGGTRHRKKEMF